MKIPIWIKIILVVIVICGLYWVFNQSQKDTTADKVTDETFQHEVLESSIPVLVVLCNDELWNRKSVPWSLKEPPPILMAIKQIMKEKQYKGKVKFLRYTVPDGSYNRITKSFDNDPLCKEFNIKWLPTVIIFKDSSINKKLEGGGCTVEESKEKMERELRRILL